MCIIRAKKDAGFTLVELILSIALIAIIVPIGATVLSSMLNNTLIYRQNSQALGFAKNEMAIANSLPFSDPSMAHGSVTTYPKYKGSGLTVRRFVKNISGSDNPAAESLKQIQVMVKSKDNSINLELDTRRANKVGFGAPAPLGDEASYLNAEQGKAILWHNWLYLFSLENTNPTDPITIEKMKMEWKYPPSDSAFSEPNIQWIYLNGGTGGIYLGPDSTLGSGVIINFFNAVNIPSGKKTSANYIEFTNPFPSGTKVDFTITFYLKDGSEKEFKLKMTAL